MFFSIHILIDLGIELDVDLICLVFIFINFLASLYKVGFIFLPAVISCYLPLKPLYEVGCTDTCILLKYCCLPVCLRKNEVVSTVNVFGDFAR